MENVSKVSVGDISKVEGRGGQLRRPSPSLQYLMDCALPPKKQWCSDLPDFMHLDHRISLLRCRGWSIGVVDDRSGPERNGVSGHPLLPLRHKHKEARYIQTILLCFGQILPKGFDGTEQKLIPITIHKIVQWGNGELIKTEGHALKDSLAFATKFGR